MSLDAPHMPSGPRASSHELVDRALASLDAARGRVARLRPSFGERWRLINACLAGVAAAADDWVSDACRAKGVALGSAAAAEEIATGPIAVLRSLQVTRRVLMDLARRGAPRLHGSIREGPGGRLRIGVLPFPGLYDGILFRGFSAEIWTLPDTPRQKLHGDRIEQLTSPAAPAKIVVVLGAGNVSAIAATDALDKLFHEGRLVLVKMNPVNEYLGPHFERAFRPLIDAGLLRIVYGGADVGAYCVRHPSIDEVHITGSVASHDAIVWGPDGEEREARRQRGEPLLSVPITSELGNVTPWIVVPGPYTDAELRFQAENVAAMLVHNASFNCIALRMIVTWRAWPARQAFLDMIDEALRRVPRRKAYYPGAVERYTRFSGREPADADGFLPWTIVRDVRDDEQRRFFREESFACVAAETSLDAASEEAFLDAAVEFANTRLWGTLGAGMMVHPAFRRRTGNQARFVRAVTQHRYGTVAVNHWPALSYALMTTPWGGYPGGTLADPQSGIGWVHNPLLIDRVEKSVLEGPLVVRPKPFWFPSHRQAWRLARGVVGLYRRARWWKLPPLLIPALRG